MGGCPHHGQVWDEQANKTGEIRKKLEKTRKINPFPTFYLKPLRNGSQKTENSVSEMTPISYVDFN
jgi:hypothetical protein